MRRIEASTASVTKPADFAAGYLDKSNIAAPAFADKCPIGIKRLEEMRRSQGDQRVMLFFAEDESLVIFKSEGFTEDQFITEEFPGKVPVTQADYLRRVLKIAALHDGFSKNRDRAIDLPPPSGNKNNQSRD